MSSTLDSTPVEGVLERLRHQGFQHDLQAKQTEAARREHSGKALTALERARVYQRAPIAISRSTGQLVRESLRRTRLL